jgi:EAL domain-containing protein (putative c-di-GMP-specific phosphodiesterase class I)
MAYLSLRGKFSRSSSFVGASRVDKGGDTKCDLSSHAKVDYQSGHESVRSARNRLATPDVTASMTSARLNVAAGVDQTELRMAEVVWQAMRDDAIRFTFQRVRHTTVASVTLYHECLARVSDEDGREISPSKFIPVLEAMGLIRIFDRYVVGRVVKLLGQRVDVSLGVNVSALSAVDDELWAPTLIFLATRPDIAHRLVVEITETSEVDPISARAFVAHLRRVGCRVAIDDFGVGYSLNSALAIAQADIIKIDASWMLRARQGDCLAADIKDVVTFASNLGSRMVLEGIETVADLELGHRIGVEWVQGYLFGQQSTLCSSDSFTKSEFN